MHIYLVLIFFAVSNVAWAAPDCADPSPAESHIDSASTSVSVAYTTRSGSNQVLFFGIGGRSLNTQNAATSVQIGGNNMTQLGTALMGTPSYGQWWYYPNPPAGTNNATATLSAAPTNGDFVVFVCNDVDTGDPIRSSAEATGSSTTPSSTPGTVNSTDTVIDYFTTDDQSAPSVGANQTDLVSGCAGSSCGGSSYQAGSNGGAMTWTIGSDDWTSHSAALKAAPSTDVGGEAVWFH